MVEIIPEVPSFASRLGAALGGGIQQGLGKAADFAMQLGLEAYKNKQRQKALASIEGPRSFSSQLTPEMREKQFLEGLPLIEKQLGRELTPDDLDQIWSIMGKESASSEPYKEDPYRKAKQYAALGEHDLSRIASEEAKIGEKERVELGKEKRARHFEVSKKALEESENLARVLPVKEAALEHMQEAVESGNLSFFSPDNLAEITGIEGLRSAKGAAFKTASKEYFMGNLSRVGAKGLNQWLEKQLADMSPKIGRKPEANLAVTEILRAENDVARKQIELTNFLADKYESELGYIPRDLSARVEKDLSSYAKERQKEAKSRIEDIIDRYTPVTKEGRLMYDPMGNLRRVPGVDIKEAKKEGYREYK